LRLDLEIFGLFSGPLDPMTFRVGQNPKTVDFGAPLGTFWGLLVLENQEIDGLYGYAVGFH